MQYRKIERLHFDEQRLAESFSETSLGRYGGKEKLSLLRQGFGGQGSQCLRGRWSNFCRRCKLWRAVWKPDFAFGAAGLKLIRFPRSLAPTLVTLPSMSLFPIAPLQS